MNVLFPPMSISVVVPVFNASHSLTALVRRLVAALEHLVHQYEILLINDGSADDSWQVIIDLAGQYSHVRGIDLMKNYGQHNALLAGTRLAAYEVIVTIDDDLQNPPEEIAKLINKLEQGFDVVYGTPTKEQHSVWRNLTSRLTKAALQTTMGAQTARQVSAFRAFRACTCQGFINYRGPFVSIDVLLSWSTRRFASVQVQHDERLVGESNYGFQKLVIHGLNLVTGFSVLPLRIASLVGFGSLFFGLLVFAYVIIRYFVLGGSVPGFPFLASIITIFAGAELFALGIIGEYLARIHFRSMEKPAFIIRQSVPSDSGHPQLLDGGNSLARAGSRSRVSENDW